MSQTTKARSGTMIAIGAAALILAGCAGNGGKSASMDHNMVHCSGVNSCKGTGACKTAENACKGQNVCKGHGFLALTEAECSTKGGTVM